MRHHLRAILLMLLLFSFPAAANDAVLVGNESGVTLQHPLPKLVPKAVEKKAPVILRIASAVLKEGVYTYDLRYMGLRPGKHDITQFLQNEDGSAPKNLTPIIVEINGLLPESHDGVLEEVKSEPLGFLGSYRMLVITAISLWALALLPILLWKREKRRVISEAPPPPAPTLAEILKPIVEKAASGELDLDGQAQLERLTIAFLREKHQIPRETSAEEALHLLKQNAASQGTLQALEAWLHSPARDFQAGIASILKAEGSTG